MSNIYWVFTIITCYAVAALGQWVILKTHRNGIQWGVNVLVGMGLLLHSYVLYHVLHDMGGIAVTPWSAGLLVTWSMLAFTLVAACYEPVHNLYLLLLPVVIIVLWITYLLPITELVLISNGALLVHILLSFMAYSLATITASQAVLIGYQDNRLRGGKVHVMMHIFPPLQTMERLLFALLAASWLLLSAALLSGLSVLKGTVTPYIVHRMVFSVCAWCLFTCVLWGRWHLGWRGQTAVKCILSGFFLLFLAYLGSRLLL